MALTDRRMAQLGRMFKDLKTTITDYESKRNEIGKKLLAEATRRGTRTMDTNGVKLTKVTPTETRYDWDALAAALTRKQLRAIQKQEVDVDLLSREVQAGRIDPVVVSQCSIVVEKAPYMLVTLGRQEGE